MCAGLGRGWPHLCCAREPVYVLPLVHAAHVVATAVINLVYVVKRHLRLVHLTDADLRAMKLPPCGARVMRNFAYAFASYAFFFHEVVCACLEVVHAQWMQLKASDNTLTLLQFNAGVLDDVPRALNKAFRSPVLTQRQFRVRLAKAKGAIAFSAGL